jgi:hypothetical protein
MAEGPGAKAPPLTFTRWLRVGDEFINLDACPLIEKIPDGYTLYHGTGNTNTTVRVDPRVSRSAAAVDAVKEFLSDRCVNGG